MKARERRNRIRQSLPYPFHKVPLEEAPPAKSHAWKRRNSLHRMKARLTHPWPFYKRAGGINAVVHRATGEDEDLGRISDYYISWRGWKVSGAGTQK